MARVASGRHIFEVNVNRFALFLQVHGAKPRDDFPQQPSIRQRSTGGLDPVDNLGRGLHPSPTARKAKAQAPLQTPRCLSRHQQSSHERPPQILQKPRAHRHDRRLAAVAIRPRPNWASPFNMVIFVQGA
jgi:hypothetical protein